MKVGKYKIPFNPISNNMQNYHYAGGRCEPVWKDNYEFEAILEYQGFERGRSAAHLIFKDTNTNLEYTMFLKEFDSCVNHMVNGKIAGTWTFIKRGTNYGIVFLNQFTKVMDWSNYPQ